MTIIELLQQIASHWMFKKLETQKNIIRDVRELKICVFIKSRCSAK